ncbi:hypothetical protein JZU48_05185, partial [bacterium]|nr:hypothetical protein [bacterium]
MDELALDTPVCTWHKQADGPGPGSQIGSFVRDLLTPAPAHANADNSPEKQEESGNQKILRIKKISFEQGTVRFSDHSLSPAWAPAITG